MRSICPRVWRCCHRMKMMEAPNELRPRHQGQISLDKHVKWSDSAMYRTISKLTYYFLMKCQHQNLQVQVPTFESDANGVLNTEHLAGYFSDRFWWVGDWIGWQKAVGLHGVTCRNSVKVLGDLIRFGRFLGMGKASKCWHPTRILIKWRS